MAVAFHHGPFGGAAKAERWAARIPYSGCRTDPAARHHRAYPGISGHFRASSGHIRTREDRRVRDSAGSCAVRPVAAGMAHRRIACRTARRGGNDPLPDTAERMVVVCGMAGRRIACRKARRSMTSRPVPYRRSPDRVRYGPSRTHISSHPGPPRRPHVSAMLTVRRTDGPSSAMPRPNSACSRRRHRRCTNVYSYVMPWRFIGARSAARLRRTVGRHLNPKATNRTAGHAAARIKNIHFNDKYRTPTIKYRYSRKEYTPQR